MRKVLGLFAMVFVVVSSAVGCGGGGNGGPVSQSVAGLGEPCSKATTCETGLYCGAADWVDGICTADCDGFGTCEPHYGSAARCSGINRGVCIKECTSDDDCKGASCVKLPGASYSACTR